MSKFDDLKNSMEIAEAVYDNEKAKFENLITNILAIFNLNDDHFDQIYICNDIVTVNYSWRAAGCKCSDSITLPKWIFDDTDPVAAAKIYKTELENKKKSSKRKDKFEELKRLKKELGVE